MLLLWLPAAASRGQGIAAWLLDGMRASLLIYMTRVEIEELPSSPYSRCSGPTLLCTVISLSFFIPPRGVPEAGDPVLLP